MGCKQAINAQIDNKNYYTIEKDDFAEGGKVPIPGQSL